MNTTTYTLRLLNSEDIPLILDLQDAVFSAMAQADNLRRNTDETLSFCFERTHFIPGIFEGNQLLAVCIFVDAAGTDEDLSLHLHQFETTKPINYKVVLVHPLYRGHGWQRYLFQLCAELCLKHGYEQMIATVAPDNLYSYRNLIKFGFQEDHREVKYGGLLRAVMFLDLNKRKDTIISQTDYSVPDDIQLYSSFFDEK